MKIFLLALLISVWAFADSPGGHVPMPGGQHGAISPSEEKVVKMETWYHRRIKAAICAGKYGDGLVATMQALVKEPAFKEAKIEAFPAEPAMAAMEKVLKLEPSQDGLIERIQRVCMALPQPEADKQFKAYYGEVAKMKLLDRLQACERLFDPYERAVRDRYRGGLELRERMRYLRRFMADVYQVALDDEATFAAKYKQVTGKDLPTWDDTRPLAPALQQPIREALEKAEDEAEKQFGKLMQKIRNPETGILPGDIIRRIDRVHQIFEEHVAK